MLPLAIFAAALAVFLPFNAALPVTDPVEANYALTAKEMLLSGDWLSPRIYGEYWFDKPAMIYWLIILSYKIFGITDFAARFPTAVFSAASVCFACWFGQRIWDSRRAGILAALVLATSLEYWVLARMIITDAVLFFFTSVGMAALYLGLTERGKTWQTIAYACAGLAVLTKGPVGIVLPGIIIFAYIIIARRWELIGRLWLLPGLLIFLAVAAPWYFVMYKLHGQVFVDTFLGLHNYLRATVSEHPQYNVFYYYLVLFPVSLLPWTGVFFRAFSGKKPPHFSFLAVWIGITVLFYTLMATKYPTYVFPATFPAALLIAYKLDTMDNDRPAAWLWLTIPAILLLLLLGAGANLLLGLKAIPLYTVVAITTVFVAWLQLRGIRSLLPFAVGIAVAAVSLVLIASVLEAFTESESAHKMVKAIPPHGAVVAAIGDYPTSAVYYSGYTIPKLVDEQSAGSQDIWAGKHTMPTEPVASFAARAAGNSATYIFIGKGEAPPLAGFRPVMSNRKTTLYERNKQ